MTIIVKGKNTHEHRFHIVDASPWPLTTSISLAIMLFGTAMYFHSYENGESVMSYGFGALLLSVTFWWRDVINEGLVQGMHTKAVQTGLRMSVVLFIISEVCFFATFFWAYFHSSLAPTIDIGNVWPPEGIKVVSPWGIPLTNTILLLFSGVTITASHYALTDKHWVDPDNFIMWFRCGWFKPLKPYRITIKNYFKIPFVSRVLLDKEIHDSPLCQAEALDDIKYAKPVRTFWEVVFPCDHEFRFVDVDLSKKENQDLFEHFRQLHPTRLYVDAKKFLFQTIVWATIFLAFQAFEYTEAPFTIADSIYGSTFYLLTGFHGLHVIIGTLFLIVCYVRLRLHHFSKEHHIGYEAAIWYWHFVDVVWLFLFICVYWWGGA